MEIVNYKTSVCKSWYFVREAIDRAYNLQELEMLEFAIREGVSEVLNEEFRGLIADILCGKHKGKNNKPKKTKSLRALDQMIWEKVHYFHGQGLAKYSQGRVNDAITEVCSFLERQEFEFPAKPPSYETVLKRFKNLERKKNGGMYLSAKWAFHKGKGDMLATACNAEIDKGSEIDEAIRIVSEKHGMTFEATQRYLQVKT